MTDDPKNPTTRSRHKIDDDRVKPPRTNRPLGGAGKAKARNRLKHGPLAVFIVPPKKPIQTPAQKSTAPAADAPKPPEVK